MDWQLRLIHLYEYVCQRFYHDLWGLTQRFSNNDHPAFTDEEVLTIYLFGVMQGRSQVREIYDYTHDHLLAWFPRLPSYEGYLHRLNRCGYAFEGMIRHLLEQIPNSGLATTL